MGNSIINTGLQVKESVIAKLSASQTTNFVPNIGWVEFDSSQGNIALNTGKFTLIAGRKYSLEGAAKGLVIGGGEFYYCWYDFTNSIQLGSNGSAIGVDSSIANTSQPVACAIVTPTSNIEVGLLITSVNSLSKIYGENESGGTYAKIESIEAFVSTVSTNANPPGAMVMFGGSVAPAGYLMCDGASVATVTYPNLFAAIGYGFGGAGAVFNVPDMRGASPAGVGTSTGYNVDETITLGQKINDSLQDHTHSTPNVLVAYNSGNGALNYNTGLADAVIYQAGDTSSGASTGAATVTKGKSIGVNFIIKY